MLIKIDDKFFIDKDELCYTLKEYTGKVDKDGNEVSRTYGYFSTLEAALIKLRDIRASQVFSETGASLNEYITELRKQNNEIAELLRFDEVEE